MWETPKIRGISCWGACNKDPTIQGTILGFLFRKLPCGERIGGGRTLRSPLQFEKKEKEMWRSKKSTRPSTNCGMHCCKTPQSHRLFSSTQTFQGARPEESNRTFIVYTAKLMISTPVLDPKVQTHKPKPLALRRNKVALHKEKLPNSNTHQP